MTLETYDEKIEAALKDFSQYAIPKEPPVPAGNPQVEIIAKALDRAQSLLTAKNAEYADSGDILSAFRRLADAQSIPMSSVWFFLAGKHLDVVTQYVKEYREGVSRSRTQAVSERVDDIIVYSLLLLVILEEEGRI
jgi:hypothetical protein